MKKIALIVAGGFGSRMKSEIPKQFMLLSGRPVLMHSISAFISFDKNISILLALPQNQIETWNKLCKEFSFNIEHQVVAGGETRFNSVKNGLALITDDNALVAIHDGVRPLVSQSTISACFETAEKNGNAIPGIPLNDSLRQLKDNTTLAVNRDNYRLIQTPQCFFLKQLKDAYQQNYSEKFTDDASVIEMMGGEIHLVEGNRENIKITTGDDLIIAEALMKNF